MEQKHLRRDLAVIAFTAFLNFIGLTIAIPIFTPLCLDQSGGIIAVGTSIPVRTTILGFILGIFPLCQFFASPMLGTLSDRYGRKKILLFSLAGMLAGSVIMAVSIMRASLTLAFFSRIVMGCFSGSIAVTQSAIADLSDEKSRAKNFGLIGAAFGASLFIGPALGGFLSDPAIRPWFNYATPFWLSSLLTLVNIGQVAWQLSETLPPERRRHADFHLLIGPLNVMRAFQDAVSRNMFLVVFFLGFGFNFFTQFFQVFLIDKFAATRSQLGMIFSYIGIWSILTQAVIVPKVSKKFRPPQVLTVTLLLSAGIFPVLLLAPNYPLLFAVLACIPLTNGLSNPNLTALISGLGGVERQGEILGINQSVQAMTQFLPPLIGGFIVGQPYTVPIWVAAASILIAWGLFMRSR
ncbi:MAG: MFS transporter [Proteobacteria bacterium]|nr:MFS transporter [Pseudomonadota bacterium]